MIRSADGVALHVLERVGGSETPWLLVHGLASNARMWDGVAGRLAAAGHPVVAVDLRGHGESERPAKGYDTPTAVRDVASVIRSYRWDGCALAGQSWGGNVVMELAASGLVDLAGIACVDGGWISLRRSHPRWEDCERALAPPSLAALTWNELERDVRARREGWPEDGIQGYLACFERIATGGVRNRLDRAHHLEILRSLWERDPASAYPDVRCPVLLVPAVRDAADGVARDDQLVREAESALASARVRPLAGDHDLHAQRPDEVARVLHGASAGGWRL